MSSLRCMLLTPWSQWEEGSILKHPSNPDSSWAKVLVQCSYEPIIPKRLDCHISGLRSTKREEAMNVCSFNRFRSPPVLPLYRSHLLSS